MLSDENIQKVLDFYNYLTGDNKTINDVKVELTPYQQKIENEINDFLYQEITWQSFKNFLFQEITFGKKK